MKKIALALAGSLALIVGTVAVAPQDDALTPTACTKKGGACGSNDECCSGSCSVSTHKCM